MSDNSNVSQLSPHLIELIEHKRRLAIEKRNKRQVIEVNKPLIVSNTSTSVNTISQTMTNIKDKVGSNVSPNKWPKPTVPYNRPNDTKASNVSPNKWPKPTVPYNRPNDTKASNVSPNKWPKPTVPYSGPNETKGPKAVVKASIRLLSNKTFEFDATYNEDVIKVCRRMASRVWDPNTKRWTFDINEYKNFLTDLYNISSFEIRFSDTIPDRVLTALIEARGRPKEDIDLSQRLGPKLMQRLYTFQVEGVIFAIRTGGRCLIADDMGLGKTSQAIAIAQWFRDDWPLLIICPSSLRFQWQEQVIEWLPNIKESDILIVKKVNEVLPQIPITIISYDLMARMRSQFSLECKQIYNFVVLDESHYIKSDSAMRTEAVNTLAKSSKRVLLLTGTPALSRPMELFTQIKLIEPKLFVSKHEFGLRYCDAYQKTIGYRSHWKRGQNSKYIPKQIWDYRGAKNLDELRILLETTILVRRLKTDVLKELTKKSREMIIINVDHISDKEKKKLNRYPDIVKKSSFKEDNTSLFDWYMDSSFAKIEPVCHYLDQLLNKDMKLLCFCHHKQMMDGIEAILAQKRINHIRIDGSTPAVDRHEACHEFQMRADCRVALLSITACATGLNLTASSVVVFAELFWNPGILSQAEDRVHRIGQTKDVKIYYLVAKNTIDDMIWPMISKKLEILNKAGLSKDDFEKASTAMNALEAEQHLITEFFTSMSESERKALNEDIIIE